MNTLHRPSLKLGALYLAVMMAISVFFSLNVYHLSVQEFDRGLRKSFVTATDSRAPGAGVMVAKPFEVSALPDTLIQRLADEREAQYQEAKSRVLTRLIGINLAILVGGGIVSYYLARRTLKPIEEAHEAQSRFTADASHELRTPIAAMQSEIEVALMNPKLTLPAAKKQLQSNLEELARLTTLSEGLLRLARLEDNDLEKKPVALDDVVRRAVQRMLPAAEARHMLIITPRETGIQVIGDEDSLVEALVILLDNAIKYSPENTEIAIGLSGDKHHAALAVADRGIGIKATELPHVFDRFYRADTARSKHAVQGYGLGLAIAKSIIEAHSGVISVTSKPARGTRFTITLLLS